jgi:hypothetical protein
MRTTDMDTEALQSSARELQKLRTELEVLRCRVVVTDALADALLELRALLAEEAKPTVNDRGAVVDLALARIEAVLEANPEARSTGRCGDLD